MEGRSGAQGASVRIVGPVQVRVKVQGKYTHKNEIKTIKVVKIGSSGRFKVPVATGKYTVVIGDGSRSKTLHVTVHSGKSIYVVGTVTKHAGGLAIAPVVFNY